MKSISIFLLVLTASYLVMSTFVLSADDNEYKDRATKVNELAVENLGLNLEQISLLFYFEKEQYIGDEVIDEFLAKPYIADLISKKFLVLEEVSGFRLDASDTTKYYSFVLTSKSKVLVAASR